MSIADYRIGNTGDDATYRESLRHLWEEGYAHHPHESHHYSPRYIILFHYPEHLASLIYIVNGILASFGLDFFCDYLFIYFDFRDFFVFSDRF